MAVLLASEPARDKIESVRIHKTFATQHTIVKIPRLNGEIYLANSRRFFLYVRLEFFFLHNETVDI